MQPPVEVQNLCQRYLEKVRHAPEYELMDEDRLEIYLKFGHSLILNNSTSIRLPDFTKADFVLCWLAFLTAKKVSFICKRKSVFSEWDDTSEAEEVKNILRAVQAYLNKRMTFDEANNVLQEHWFFYRPDITYDVLCAWRASMNVLEITLFGKDYYVELVPGFDTFTIQAVEAYTVIDYNLPGEGDEDEPPIPLDYDISKRLRFWEWWLIEAIPQAWELVN
ncbi:MAG: hypothetical protein BGO39_20400 [Chloroflexi bacterium 54-19]|nr:MAG: hypothetical protein BGO39_20400 [Chloroflexi bacterium 54-19]